MKHITTFYWWGVQIVIQPGDNKEISGIIPTNPVNQEMGNGEGRKRMCRVRERRGEGEGMGVEWKRRVGKGKRRK
jgi:hypothetical protein